MASSVASTTASNKGDIASFVTTGSVSISLDRPAPLSTALDRLVENAIT